MVKKDANHKTPLGLSKRNYKWKVYNVYYELDKTVVFVKYGFYFNCPLF